MGKTATYTRISIRQQWRKNLSVWEKLVLVKSAEEKIAKEEEKYFKKHLKGGDITIEEFARLIELLSKMGLKAYCVDDLRSMLGGAEIDNSTFSQIELFNQRIVIMASSMTKKEMYRLCS